MIEGDFFHGGEKQQNVGFLRAITHQAETPDFPLERADAAGDLNVEFFEELVAEFHVVDASGNRDGRDADETVLRIFHEHFNSHRFAAGDQRLLAGVMAFPTRFKAFLHGNAHRFAQGVNQGNGWSVVIEAALAPIGHGGGDIEIPALHFRFAMRENFFRARADRDGRHSRRRAESFLRAAENDVEALFVHVHRLGGKRSDRVHDEERAELVGDFAEPIEICDDAGGSFTVREANDFDFFAGSGAANVFRIDRTAERRFDFRDVRLRARSDFKHSVGKVAVDTNDGFVAGLERIYDRGFNPAGAGSGHRHGDAILRLENLAQERLRFVHAGLEERVEVANERRRQGSVDAGIDRGRAGRHQEAHGWGEFTEVGHEKSPFACRWSFSRVWEAWAKDKLAEELGRHRGMEVTERRSWEVERGYTPGVLAKSAQHAEKEGDELPLTAKE